MWMCAGFTMLESGSVRTKKRLGDLPEEHRALLHRRADVLLHRFQPHVHGRWGRGLVRSSCSTDPRPRRPPCSRPRRVPRKPSSATAIRRCPSGSSRWCSWRRPHPSSRGALAERVRPLVVLHIHRGAGGVHPIRSSARGLGAPGGWAVKKVCSPGGRGRPSRTSPARPIVQLHRRMGGPCRRLDRRAEDRQVPRRRHRQAHRAVERPDRDPGRIHPVARLVRVQRRFPSWRSAVRRDAVAMSNILVNTNLAACRGRVGRDRRVAPAARPGRSARRFERRDRRTWFRITAAPDILDHRWAVLIGFVGGIICTAGIRFLEQVKIDDVVGAGTGPPLRRRLGNPCRQPSPAARISFPS